MEADNQPDEGTEFATTGHYGSTFWDSFDGEEIVINICDPCLRRHTNRIAQVKRYLPVRCEGMQGFGRLRVDRPYVPFTGNRDEDELVLEIEDLNVYPRVEWVSDIEERKAELWRSVYGAPE
jgi:hypothetical protein